MAIMLANGMSHPWSCVSVYLMNVSPILTFISFYLQLLLGEIAESFAAICLVTYVYINC